MALYPLNGSINGSITSHLVPDVVSPLLRTLLEQAGEVSLGHFRRATRERKPDGSDVTEADRAVEEVLVSSLVKAFPGTRVVSEEGTVAGREGQPTWHVDPIDGTSAFIEQLAHWGPTVCLTVDGELVLGALYVPRLNEFYYAQRGHGAWRNGVKLRNEQPDAIARYHSIYLPSRFHRRMPIGWPGKVRALGSSAIHLAQVANGAALATVIPRWSLWDVGCGLLLVEESGGVITDSCAQPLDPILQPGEPILAGAPVAIELLAARIASSNQRSRN